MDAVAAAASACALIWHWQRGGVSVVVELAWENAEDAADADDDDADEKNDPEVDDCAVAGRRNAEYDDGAPLAVAGRFDAFLRAPTTGGPPEPEPNPNPPAARGENCAPPPDACWGVAAPLSGVAGITFSCIFDTAAGVAGVGGACVNVAERPRPTGTDTVAIPSGAPPAFSFSFSPNPNGVYAPADVFGRPLALARDGKRRGSGRPCVGVGVADPDVAPKNPRPFWPHVHCAGGRPAPDPDPDPDPNPFPKPEPEPEAVGVPASFESAVGVPTMERERERMVRPRADTTLLRFFSGSGRWTCGAPCEKKNADDSV